MNYDDELNTRATALLSRKALSLDIDPVDVFASIDWHKTVANDAHFTKLINGKVITAKELSTQRQKVRRNNEIAVTLGGIPSSATELVELLAKSENVSVDWGGVFTSATGLENVLDFAQHVRITNDTLRLGFDRPAINDAADVFYKQAKAARSAVVDDMLSTRESFDWDDFSATYFLAKETTHALNIATMQKFVHQVRRKIRGLPVHHHIMPVVHGEQGCGKTYLLERMVEPIREAVTSSDFEQVTDARNIQIWSFPVIILDEMAKAAKADVETIKHVVTADTLDRRPMCSNNTIQVKNRATFIGNSNHRLNEIIRDETGNRRFAELLFNADAPHDAINRFNFLAMWRSIQPEDADPMEAHRAELKAAQALNRTLGPVEDWLENSANAFWKGRVTTSTIYQEFKAHRAMVTAAIDYSARTQDAFSAELRRVAGNRPDLGVTKVHTREGTRWTRDAQPTPAQVKAGEIIGFPRGDA